MWILLTPADVDKGGGGKTLIHKKWIICLFFFWTHPLHHSVNKSLTYLHQFCNRSIIYFYQGHFARRVKKGKQIFLFIKLFICLQKAKLNIFWKFLVNWNWNQWQNNIFICKTINLYAKGKNKYFYKVCSKLKL